MIKYNINNYFRVKLTEHGVDILEKRHNKYHNTPFELRLTTDGFYRDQAWSIMETFGPYIGLGTRNPFETEIQIETDNELLDALENLLDSHCSLINSGDCGNWNPEDDVYVILARAAIAKAKVE